MSLYSPPTDVALLEGIAPDAVADRLASLAEEARLRGSPSAFQAMLAAALNAVQRVLASETGAREAALSLAQHERLAAMTAELRVWRAALEAALDTHGRRLVDADAPAASRSRLRLWHRADRPAVKPAPSWNAAVASLLGTLRAQGASIEALASGQPAGAPSRLLGDELAAVLHRHHGALQVEAERWAP